MMRAGAEKLGRLRAESAALFICDVQEKFRPGMPSFDAAAKAIGNSMRASQALGIPTVITGKGTPALRKRDSPLSFPPPRATAAIPIPATSSAPPPVRTMCIARLTVLPVLQNSIRRSLVTQWES